MDVICQGWTEKWPNWSRAKISFCRGSHVQNRRLDWRMKPDWWKIVSKNVDPHKCSHLQWTKPHGRIQEPEKTVSSKPSSGFVQEFSPTLVGFLSFSCIVGEKNCGRSESWPWCWVWRTLGVTVVSAPTSLSNDLFNDGVIVGRYNKAGQRKSSRNRASMQWSRVRSHLGLLRKQQLKTRWAAVIETAISAYLGALDDEDKATAKLCVQMAAPAVNEASDSVVPRTHNLRLSGWRQRWHAFCSALKSRVSAMELWRFLIRLDSGVCRAHFNPQELDSRLREIEDLSITWTRAGSVLTLYDYITNVQKRFRNCKATPQKGPVFACQNDDYSLSWRCQDKVGLHQEENLELRVRGELNGVTSDSNDNVKTKINTKHVKLDNWCEFLSVLVCLRRHTHTMHTHRVAQDVRVFVSSHPCTKRTPTLRLWALHSI